MKAKYTITKRFPPIIILFIFILFAGKLQAQWVQLKALYSGDSINCIVVSDTNIFVGTDGGGVFLSTDNGANWKAVNNGLTKKIVNTLAISGKNIYAGTNDGVFLSNNNGTNWVPVNNGLTNNCDVLTLAISGTDIFAGTVWDGVFHTTDNGANWKAINDGFSCLYITCFAVSGTNIFAGTSGGGFYLLNSAGTKWTMITMYYNGVRIGDYVNALFVSGSNILEAASEGVFLSTNYGSKWSWIMVNNSWTLNFVTSGSDIFAGTFDKGVLLSTDNGKNWTEFDKGLTNDYVNGLAVSGKNIFAGTMGAGVWRRSLSDVITTAVHSFPDKRSTAFKLDANYPNPFNSVTTIKYELPIKGAVSLTVYSSSGQKVANLINAIQEAGTYTAEWDAAKFHSGTYYYKLSVKGDKNFTQTKEMLLLK